MLPFQNMKVTPNRTTSRMAWLRTSSRGALQRAETEKWWPIIKAAGIKAQ